MKLKALMLFTILVFFAGMGNSDVSVLYYEQVLLQPTPYETQSSQSTQEPYDEQNELATSTPIPTSTPYIIVALAVANESDNILTNGSDGGAYLMATQVIQPDELGNGLTVDIPNQKYLVHLDSADLIFNPDGSIAINPAVLSSISHTTVDATEFVPTGNPNEYNMQITWTDSGGNVQTTTSATPLTVGAGQHVTIDSIDLKSTGNAGEYTVEIGWTDENGVAQTTTDGTPINLTNDFISADANNTIELGSDNLLFANGHDRVFLSEAVVSPLVSGSPTKSEITTAAGTNRNKLLYYTGSNNAADPEIKVYWIDKAGVVTILVSSQTASLSSLFVHERGALATDDIQSIATSSSANWNTAAPAANRIDLSSPTINDNSSGDFTVNASDITVSKTGKYSIDFNLSGVGDAEVNQYIQLVRNGSEVLTAFQCNQTNLDNDDGLIGVMTWVGVLNSSDTIDVRFNGSQSHTVRIQSYSLAISENPSASIIPASSIAVDDQATSGFIDIGTTRIQWGTGAGSNVVTSFPQPFANTGYSITATPVFGTGSSAAANQQRTVTIDLKSTTSFRAIVRDTQGNGLSNQISDWIAIGVKP